MGESGSQVFPEAEEQSVDAIVASLKDAVQLGYAYPQWCPYPQGATRQGRRSGLPPVPLSLFPSSTHSQSPD